jgi:hypothetical protein
MWKYLLQPIPNLGPFPLVARTPFPWNRPASLSLFGPASPPEGHPFPLTTPEPPLPPPAPPHRVPSLAALPQPEEDKPKHWVIAFISPTKMMPSHLPYFLYHFETEAFNPHCTGDSLLSPPLPPRAYKSPLSYYSTSPHLVPLHVSLLHAPSHPTLISNDVVSSSSSPAFLRHPHAIEDLGEDRWDPLFISV